MKIKLIRITTVPISLDKLLDGQMSFMKEHYEVIGISSDNTYLQKVGEKDGVKTHCVEMTRKITPFKDIKAVWQLYHFFRKEKPSIVHTHTPKAGTVGMLAAFMARVPHRLHTVAGLPLLEAKGNKRKLLNVVEKLTYKCANRIYPNSHGLQDIIIEEGFCSKNKLQVIGNGSSNGIDTAHFNPSLYCSEANAELKQQLGIAEIDFVFIFIGRLVGDKGINELITAFESLSANHDNVKLLLVGSQEQGLDPLNANTIHSIENNKNIISVGFQSDVRPYFAIADALVFPSYREGFPNVVMQAGAMGLPSIVTNINGCNEIIVEGGNGTIIPPKSIEHLESKMSEFVTNRPYVESLASRAREMVTSRYERSVVWDAILEEYKRLEREYV